MIPAFCLGFFHVRLGNATEGSTDKKELMKSHCTYAMIARLYLVTFVLTTVFWIYVCFPVHHMQLSREHIDSFKKAAHFWVLYYAVMMYVPAWILSANFLHHIRQGRQDKSCEASEVEQEERKADAENYLY